MLTYKQAKKKFKSIKRKRPHRAKADIGLWDDPRFDYDKLLETAYLHGYESVIGMIEDFHKNRHMTYDQIGDILNLYKSTLRDRMKKAGIKSNRTGPYDNKMKEIPPWQKRA